MTSSWNSTPCYFCVSGINSDQCLSSCASFVLINHVVEYCDGASVHPAAARTYIITCNGDNFGCMGLLLHSVLLELKDQGSGPVTISMHYEGLVSQYQ